jgi:hypothetical protein
MSILHDNSKSINALLSRMMMRSLLAEVLAMMIEIYYNPLKSASNLNGNLNCSKELEHYAS